jgi:hypothetical protein
MWGIKLEKMKETQTRQGKSGRDVRWSRHMKQCCIAVFVFVAVASLNARPYLSKLDGPRPTTSTYDQNFAHPPVEGGLLPDGHPLLDESPESVGGSANLPVFTTSLFTGSGRCAACHSTDGVALLDSQGNDVSPPKHWRSTMMANSFKDPYFRAVLEYEADTRENLKFEIEDSCLRCHAPMGHTQAHYDGATSFTLFDALHSEFAPLANDGVSCTVCHQIQPDNLGTMESYDGHYVIKDTREIFGPYDDVDPFQMQVAVGYTPKFGAHMLTSEHCATCHTLFTPILDTDGNEVGRFPEQTPYFEWQNSIYNPEGSDPQSCQDCHMPTIDDPIIISNDPPEGERSPFWRHYQVGGNVFMLNMLRDNITTLGLTAETVHFDETISRTLDLLQLDTAQLDVVSVTHDESDRARIEVEITNKAGHKFPTGYPARRAWLHLTARDTSGTLLFESGSWNDAGEIIGHDADFEPHYDAITSATQVQIYESVMGDLNGDTTTSLLAAAQYKKDNRLPPIGYRDDGTNAQFTTITGMAASDDDFNRSLGGEGTGSDRIAYEFDISGAALPITIELELVYQSVSPRHLGKLRANPGEHGALFLQLYEEQSNAPVIITNTSAQLVEIDNTLWIFH